MRRARSARGPPRSDPAGERLASLLVEVAPLGPGPLAGHVRLVVAPCVVAHVGTLARIGLGAARRDRRRPPRARRCRWRCRAPARAGCGPGGRRAPRAGAPPARRPTGRPRSDAGTPCTNADTTAAIGIPKIAPGMPAIRPPMRTEPRTTIGWMPTAPCMIRGWRTFMTTNQPAPIRMSAGRTASGWRTRATMTGGAQDTNGPKNGIIWSSPAATEVRAASGRPSASVGAERDQEVDEAHQRLAAQEAAERARDRRLEQARLLRVRSAARSGTGRRARRRGRGPCRSTGRTRSASSRRRPGWRPRSAGAAATSAADDLVEVAEGRLGLGDQVDLAEPDRVQPLPATAPRISGRFGLDVRDRRRELGDRGRQRAGGDDDEQDEERARPRCRRGSWRPRAAGAG